MSLNVTKTKSAKAIKRSTEHNHALVFARGGGGGGSGRGGRGGRGRGAGHAKSFSGPLAIVDGLVQGDVQVLGGLVFVGPEGRCEGSVKAHRLRIEGEVQGGPVDVDTVIEVLAEGKLSARITHGKVDASPGAILDVVEERVAPALALEAPAPSAAPAPIQTATTGSSPAIYTGDKVEAAASRESVAAETPVTPENKVRVAFRGGFRT